LQSNDEHALKLVGDVRHATRCKKSLANTRSLCPPNVFEKDKAIGELARRDAKQRTATTRPELNDDAERQCRSGLEERARSRPEDTHVAALTVLQDAEHQAHRAVRQKFDLMPAAVNR
jgi:hypothetical protein